ncbi:MAG TPA: FAD-dependent thymidylate synthase [Elusimicrobia bacterium]|nr:FAD-dependent thymidylate synthase [Elusimicrobiota bacterium]HBT62341.1 FAD-dependent thymidylate synthase [Elusimicrobiota bacterium]
MKKAADVKPVLDKGFVRLVDMMGGDRAVLDAARVCYDSRSKGEALDRRLIAYLLKHSHLTPFEHAVFKFHVAAPIFVARQWFRHRFAAYNEVSFRYTEVKDEFYVPRTWRAQDAVNKQGSAAAAGLDHAALSAKLESQVRSALKAYREMLAAGAAREMARFVLPVNLYTQFYWTVNCRSLMNFVSLRADEHAQWEMQQYALALAEFFRERMPWTWDSFLSHSWKGFNPAMEGALRANAGGATP